MHHVSILGPLLFYTYVNDIASGLDTWCLMYADEMKLSGTTNHEAIQRDLDKFLPGVVELGPSVKLEQISAARGRRSKFHSPHGCWASGRDETTAASKRLWNGRECRLQTLSALPERGEDGMVCPKPNLSNCRM